MQPGDFLRPDKFEWKYGKQKLSVWLRISTVPYQNISIFTVYIDIFSTGVNELRPVRTGILLLATRDIPYGRTRQSST